MFDGGPQGDFTVQFVDWPVLSNGFGVSHPYLWQKGQGFGWRSKKKQEAIRQRALGYEPFARAVLSSRFAVAHSRWPEALQEGFGLEEPPSPFETASRLISESVMNNWPAEHRCGKSALLWWLVGIPEDVLEGIVPDWQEEARGAIGVLMGRSSFALWALGTNLLPLATSRRKAMALLTTTGHFRREREEMHHSVIVQQMLRKGGRPDPVERQLPAVCPLWQDMEERREWEGRGKWMTRLERFRTEAWDILDSGRC